MSAPSAPRTRTAASTVDLRTTRASVAAVTCAASSRIACSPAARWASSSRDLPSSATSRLFAIAIDACVARALRTSASSSSNACIRRETTDSAPRGPASEVSGAERTDRTPVAFA